MALPAQVASIYNAEVNSANITYQSWPQAASIPVGGVVVKSAVGASTWGAWTEIVASAVVAGVSPVPNPCWLVGVQISIVETADANVFGLAIGTGAGGSEVSRFQTTFDLENNSAAGVNIINPQWLPYPIEFAGSPRIAARTATLTNATQRATSVNIITASGVGT